MCKFWTLSPMMLWACGPPPQDASALGARVEHYDVAYPPPDGGDAVVSTMDLYTVDDGMPRGLLVFVHGGSWIGGDKENLDQAPELVTWFLDRGYVVAAPNFRLATPDQPDGVTYADQATDLAWALAWLGDHGSDYGVTEPEPVLLGYSSGAHLVALLATDPGYLDAVGRSLAAVVSLDVHAYDVSYALDLMVGSELQENIPLIEGLFGTTEADQDAASPGHHATGTDVPPSLIVSADASSDPGTKGQISLDTGDAYAAVLAAAGHPVDRVHFDTETHGSLVIDFGSDGDGPTEAVDGFLETHGPFLGNAP